MPQQTYVFSAELVGFEGVRRTVTVHDDLTLVDLHYALQSAFGWDDDHLYSFWLGGAFWGDEVGHYVHPFQAASIARPGKSACARLDELDLSEGQRLAYVFDFASEWRVALTLKEKRPVEGRAAARCIERVGVAPRLRDDLHRPEPAPETGQETVEFVALMSEEGDAA